MARTGLYKSDVKKARDSLLAQGQYPSIDAVRSAVGNTGSKTTIHKYLKELEEEEGAAPRAAPVSDAIQDLIERLAARLKGEAEEGVRQAAEQLAFKEKERSQQIKQLESDLQLACDHAADLETKLIAATAERDLTRSALQAETVARHTAEQRAAGLKDRLAENEQHRQSLEDKHAHARTALEHYRQAAKEQRDQDHRRHEQQLQQVQAEMRQQQQAALVRHAEITQLNQEGARLVTELSHTKQSLYEQLTNNRKLEQKLEQQQALQLHTNDVERQLARKTAEAQQLAEQLKAADLLAVPANTRIRELELELAQASARVLAQEQMGDQLRTYVDKIAAGQRALPIQIDN